MYSNNHGINIFTLTTPRARYCGCGHLAEHHFSESKSCKVVKCVCQGVHSKGLLDGKKWLSTNKQGGEK